MYVPNKVNMPNEVYNKYPKEVAVQDEGINLYNEKQLEKKIQELEDLRLCHCKYGMLWITDFNKSKN